MAGRLDGQVVIVTGASMGIGRALAREYAAEGARVVLAARSRDRLEELERQIAAAGGEARAIVTDVCDDASVRALVDGAVAAYGRVDVLVNNAGLGLRGPLHRVAVGDLRYVLDVNVLGAVRCIQAVAPVMMRQGGGLIINVSSVAGRRALPRWGGYAASKFALNGLSDALRIELAPHGIRVMNVLPGYTTSSFGQNSRGEAVTHGRPMRLPDVPAERVARQIAAATLRPRRELYTHPRERWLAALAGALPWLAEAVLVGLERRRIARETGGTSASAR